MIEGLLFLKQPEVPFGEEAMDFNVAFDIERLF